ncbi:FAD-dependent oxidoreductase domain-containing protein 2 [Strongylocentrotus purpuratus]|uniref:FAD-dependent oxidoreductase domain-containing protein 2 n=1 Tax=Strongylocentrotus purpuratus TaxID=7668 RepID=A0A7M7SYA8_STRPU|nr:FAD-dependent oxidoreductase domain-containing protein 2-like [Strongylocentrotus purpuratus]XP_030840171.1 FAD-dependent oxidoreductase domain-containing protein 2-like [Strongylocentrotus purpuratus]XP_030840175.1 FAD-dependent oxidoreductase domain-containing protein 2 [Strongylocentrotus purpuratus]
MAFLQMILPFLLCTFLIPAYLTEESSAQKWNYCVVGAGPSGLQMGFFLERAGRNYVIFEKANMSGSFFNTYPRHRKLISINKRHTGKTNKEFNMRHDWNSLLSDDESLLMKHYSKEFFPDADTYVKYLNDYTTKLGLNVQYNTEISDIARHEPPNLSGQYFTMQDQHGNGYQCRVMVISTGMHKPNIPTFQGQEYTEGYEDMSLDRDDFEGKSVLILGRGNSAFETADHIIGSTNVIHVMGRSRVKMAWETHYVGDLRAINNGLLDTYQLKSLDGLLEADMVELSLVKRSDGRLQLIPQDGDLTIADKLVIDNFALRHPYDKVIRCLGFTFDFSIFENSTAPQPGSKKRTKKYPFVKANYEAAGIRGMFFAGTNTHSIDFKKSAGGFIHGFRYTTRVLHHLLEWRYHSVPWPSIRLPMMELLDRVVRRLNEASGLYQMFYVLSDVILLHKDTMEFEYLEEFPTLMLPWLQKASGHNHTEVLVLIMEYGKNFSGAGKDVFRSDRAVGEPEDAHLSNFLHPVIYHYKTIPTLEEMNGRSKHETIPKPDSIHHFVEDFLTDWTAPTSHILVFRRFLESVMGTDMRYFFDQQCFQLALTHTELPLSCQHYWENGQGLPATQTMLDSTAHMTWF